MMIAPSHGSLARTVLVLAALATPPPAAAQIQRHPTGVNVNAQGATTVFITFGNLAGYVPVEAMWCGALVPAAPDLGDRCDPGTLYGQLPLRFARSRASGTDALTDIMSIPPSVARRAYQAAAAGEDSRFFYVRRFVDASGGSPDEYVTVTCRLTDGGARTPFSLLDVRVAFATGDAVMSVAADAVLAPVRAEIAYTGTGVLTGRWEVVRPGDDPPADFDLLTEATLPLELRGTQKRYTEIGRFRVFLPPGGRATLPGPRPEALPVDAAGLYQLLLRIEASDDKEGDSDLAALGAGASVVHAGAVAGFPIPGLRYLVGAEGPLGTASERLRLLFPAADSVLAPHEPPTFSWTRATAAYLYRLEVRPEGGDEPVLSALLRSSSGAYRAPAWLAERLPGGVAEWRVVSLDGQGDPVETTPWRRLGLSR